MNIKKKILSLLTAVAILGNGFVCSTVKAQNLYGTIKCSGSTALLPLVKTAAEDFMKSNAKVNIEVGGGGSGTGIQQCFDGIVNIGNSDVLADSKKYPGLVAHEVAIIPFVFIVNPGVNIKGLKNKQFIDILSGKITNWKDVGGNDLRIQVVNRQESSGTRKTIKNIVLNDKELFTKNAIVQESNGAVKATVANTPGSIGFVDLAYVNNSVKALSYNGIEPTLENINSKKYEILTIGRMYTKGEATGLTKAFLDYIKSPVFQNRVVPMYKFGKLSTSSKSADKKIKIEKTNKKKPIARKKIH